MNKILISIIICLSIFSCGKRGSLEYPVETSYLIGHTELI